jgi:hypothetical protein
MTKMLHGLWVIFLIYSCSTPEWNWTARPYKANHIQQTITGSDDGDIIFTDQPAFSDYWCFHYENIAELKNAIDTVKGFVIVSKDLSPNEKDIILQSLEQTSNTLK